MKSQQSSIDVTRSAILAAACLALNLGLGKVSNVLQLPIVFDTVGTILAAALIHPFYVLVVAALSSLLGGIIIHPAFPFYIGTQIVIALLAILAVHRGWFSRLWSSVLTGLGIGIASAVVSAPVTAVVFGGVTIPSVTALNVLLLASGQSLWKSVLGGALIIESIDKMIAGATVWLLLRRLPARLTRGPRAGVPLPER